MNSFSFSFFLKGNIILLIQIIEDETVVPVFVLKTETMYSCSFKK